MAQMHLQRPNRTVRIDVGKTEKVQRSVNYTKLIGHSRSVSILSSLTTISDSDGPETYPSKVHYFPSV
jgi:hypothetical protein